MEDTYKLEYFQKNKNILIHSEKIRKFLFRLWLILLLFSIVYLAIILIANKVSRDFKYASFLFIFTFNFMFGPGILTIYYFPLDNTDYKKLKDIGKKDKAYIVYTGAIYYSHRSSYDTHYSDSDNAVPYITILYKEKYIKIHDLKYNKAYKILQLLLDSQSYPIRETVGIPIDIYVYENKIYADLESVCLSKLSGYGEAEKIVNEVEKMSEYKSDF